MSKTKSTPPGPALLFIPDISGFTRFVNNTEIEHAQHIIQELLDNIIQNNTLGLEVSEIEGDAILFFRKGKAPDANELLEQIRKMFLNFHAELKQYDKLRICDCGACSSANDLTLKFFVHYGQVAQNRIGQHSKLFGADVILIHRLMKNKVDGDDYALFTDALAAHSPGWDQMSQLTWTSLQTGSEEYDLGPVPFSHISLSELMKEVPEPQPESYRLKGKTEDLFVNQIMIDAPMDLVFDVVSDLGFRHHWLEGLIDSAELNSKITRNGSTHRCVIRSNDSDPFFVTHDIEKKNGVIRFLETDMKKGFLGSYTLRPIDENTTHLEVVGKANLNPIKKWLFNLFFRKKAIRDGIKSLNRLNDYCKQLVAEGKEHPNRIVLKEGVKV